MQKVYVTINKFHEKKRRIEYAAIKRKLNIPDEDTVLQCLTLDRSQKKGEKKAKALRRRHVSGKAKAHPPGSQSRITFLLHSKGRRLVLLVTSLIRPNGRQAIRLLGPDL